MDSPIPPDPYDALGVSKESKASDIKLAYRKLVLKWHPDKVNDEAHKAKAVEEFHKIQQAYELLSDDDRRSRYDAQVRLMELKAERVKLSGGHAGIRVETRSSPAAGYETRTAAPAGFRAPTRAYTFDDRRPTYSSYSDEDLPRPSVRRTSEYASVRRSPKEFRDRESDRDRERAREKERERDEKERRDAERAREARIRDKERDYDRSTKTSRQREDVLYEEVRRSRDRDADARRPTIIREDTQERMSATIREAEAHMSRGSRPAAARTSSTAQYAYIRRPTADTSSRRSPPRDGRDRPSRREAEIVEERRPPTLRKNYSEPEPLASMAEKPALHHSYTTMTDSDQRRRSSLDDSPSLPRAQTMPTQYANSRSKASQPSKLRETATAAGSEYSASPKRTVYTYDTTNGTQLRDEKVYRTVTREPTSGSSRPSVPPLDTKTSAKTAHMMANLGLNSASPRTPLETPSSRTSAYASYESRSSIRGSRSPERGSLRQDRKLYGEISTPIGTPRSSRGSGGSYFPEVSYSPRYGPADVKYASGRPRPSRESSYDDAPKPGISRSSTAVY